MNEFPIYRIHRDELDNLRLLDGSLTIYTQLPSPPGILYVLFPDLVPHTNWAQTIEQKL